MRVHIKNFVIVVVLFFSNLASASSVTFYDTIDGQPPSIYSWSINSLYSPGNEFISQASGQVTEIDVGLSIESLYAFGDTLTVSLWSSTATNGFDSELGQWAVVEPSGNVTAKISGISGINLMKDTSYFIQVANLDSQDTNTNAWNTNPGLPIATYYENGTPHFSYPGQSFAGMATIIGNSNDTGNVDTPSTLLMLALGLVGLGASRGKKK